LRTLERGFEGRLMHLIDDTEKGLNVAVNPTHTTVRPLFQPWVVWIDKLTGVTTATGFIGSTDAAVGTEISMRRLVLHRD
jgi:hypothetical protein